MADKQIRQQMNKESDIQSKFPDKLMDDQQIYQLWLKSNIQKDRFMSQIQGNESSPIPQLDKKTELQTFQGPNLDQNVQSQLGQTPMPMIMPIPILIPMQIPFIPNQNQNPEPRQPNHLPQIFSEKSIKVTKNTNVTKYFNNFFIHKCTTNKYLKHFQGEPKLLNEVRKFITQQKKQYLKNHNWNNTIDSMIKIFGLAEGSSNPEKRSLIMRTIAKEMIYEEMIPDVLKSTRIGKKNCYIYTLITLSHRCSNLELMTRTQIA